MDINEFKIEIGKRLSGDFEHDLLMLHYTILMT